MVQSKLTNVVDVKVMADMISAGLEKQIKFLPLATVNRDLVGRPGSTLNFPAWKYIGDATIVAEGVAIDPTLMSASETPVTIKKAAKGAELTDESVLSGLGDPIGETNKQLGMSIAAKVDNELMAAALTATQNVNITTATTITVENLEAAVDLFEDEGEDLAMVLLANPVDAAALRKDARVTGMIGSDVGANGLINGTKFDVLGVQVVASRKVVAGAPILIQEGALGLALKRDVEIESDRDILKKTTVITADEHYGAYLYNEKKVVKFTTL